MTIHVLPASEYFPDTRARIRVSREIGQRPIRRHRHEFRELVLILSGEALHNQDGRWHRIQRGHVLFIGEGSFHGYRETRQLNLVNVLLNQEACKRMERDLASLPGYHELFSGSLKNSRDPMRQLILEERDIEQVSDWIDRIEQETVTPSSEGLLVAEAYLTLLVALLLRRRESGQPEAPRRDNLTTVISWMEAHLHQPVQVPELARRAALSERDFYRKFKILTGTTPARYILDTRLKRAAILLKKTRPRLSCREISRQCGFPDANYFSTRFRRAYGVAPMAYRTLNNREHPGI